MTGFFLCVSAPLREPSSSLRISAPSREVGFYGIKADTTGGVSGNSVQSRTRFRRRAFPTTETLLIAMAALAMTGLRRSPKKG